MKQRILPISFLFFFVLSFLSIAPKLVFAAIDEGNLGAYPTHFDPDNTKTKSWFIYELKPGQTKEDSITVVNTSEKTLTVKMYPVDATTTSDGAFALFNEDQRQNEVGEWVHLSKSEITVGPKDRVDVPFTITIPKYTTVGDHAGGIIIQEAKVAAAATKGMGVTIVSRVGTRIYETVPGAKIINMDIQNLTYKIVDDHLAFTYTLVNKGNVILTPTGHFDITDRSGKKIDTINLGNLGSVFPNKPTTITTTSHISTPWFGQYTGTVFVTYSPLKEIQKSIPFFIYIKDWREILPIALLLLLILLFNLRKVFFHAHKIKTASMPSVQPAAGQPQSRAATSATVDNVDQAFLARHIKLLVGLVCFTILVLSLLFAFVLQMFVRLPAQAKSSSEAVQTPASTQTQPTTVPSATTIPVDKAGMKITILNGSGKAGEAKKVAEQLTKAGFTVGKTGNALENVSQTIIHYPPGKTNEASVLEEALQPEYAAIKQEASDSANFTVILGQQ